MSAFLAIIFLIILSHRAAEVKTKNADQTTDRAATAAQSATWEQLAALAPEQLQQVDVATVNLLCAAGLAGAEGLDIASCRRTLDQWAERVRSETERNWHRFRDNPSEFEHSEGYFRMLLTAVVFYEDFHIRYNPSRMTSAASASPNDKFFADSRDVFLHGLLGPRHSGTCSSLPVLYVAIGRRLGYPLKLVTTKAHLFLRWEDDKERFNLEATGAATGIRQPGQEVVRVEKRSKPFSRFTHLNHPAEAGC